MRSVVAASREPGGDLILLGASGSERVVLYPTRQVRDDAQAALR